MSTHDAAAVAAAVAAAAAAAVSVSVAAVAVAAVATLARAHAPAPRGAASENAAAAVAAASPAATAPAATAPLSTPADGAFCAISAGDGALLAAVCAKRRDSSASAPLLRTLGRVAKGRWHRANLLFRPPIGPALRLAEGIWAESGRHKVSGTKAR